MSQAKNPLTDDPSVANGFLFCDACYAMRGYGFCDLHAYLFPLKWDPAYTRPAGKQPPLRRVTMYLSRDKDSNYDLAETIWPPGNKYDDARRAFAYALLEVEVRVEVDLRSGLTRILGVEGVSLTQPTDWHS